jgi:hypothetical protein
LVYEGDADGVDERYSNDPIIHVRAEFSGLQYIPNLFTQCALKGTLIKGLLDLCLSINHDCSTYFPANVLELLSLIQQERSELLSRYTECCW